MKKYSKFTKKQKSAIGSFVKINREKKTLSQFELAARLQVSQSAVSKFESGKMIPDLATWHQICEEFGVFPHYLKEFNSIFPSGT